MARTGEEINKLIKTQSTRTLQLSIQNLIDIYKDNWMHIISEELRDQFTTKEFKRLKLLITQEVNLLKRWVNEISVVYKNEPVREAIIKDKEEVEISGITTVQEKEIDETYAKVEKESNIDITMPTVNQYTNLTNHLLIRTKYVDGKIVYDIHTFNNAEVLTDPDDFRKIIAIKYFIGQNLPQNIQPNKHTALIDTAEDLLLPGGIDLAGQSFDKAKLWTIETDQNGNEVGFIYTFKIINGEEILIESETVENPYRNEDGTVLLPFVLTMKTYPINQLFDFSTGNDIRDATINAAIWLVHINSLGKYQSYKQVFIRADDISAIGNPEFGPASVVMLENGENPTEIGLIDLETAIDKIWDIIKQRMLFVLANNDLSPDNIELSGNPASGFALTVRNMGKLEAREKQIPFYRHFESDVFDHTRIIWNFHNPGNKINEEAKLKVDFAEITFPKSADEKMKAFQFGKENNLITPIDLIMEKNPDLTESEALTLFKKNKAFNEAQRTMVEPIQQPNGGNSAKVNT